MARIRHPGRAWAYTGAITGGVLSMAANVAAVALPPAGAPAHWSPSRVLIGVSALWPVLLFIAFEIAVRVRWSGQHRWARMLAMAAVVSVPAIASYQHMSGLLARLGESRVICVMGPLALDGLMLMATLALMSMAQTDRSAGADRRPFAYGRA